MNHNTIGPRVTTWNVIQWLLPFVTEALNSADPERAVFVAPPLHSAYLQARQRGWILETSIHAQQACSVGFTVTAAGMKAVDDMLGVLFPN